MKILIIDNYDSFTFNLYQLISVVTKGEVIVRRNNEISLDEIRQMQPSHIILSPGPGHPAIDRDFGVCKDVVKSASALSARILGVCLGHQGIAQHCGGQVVRAAQPVHGKMSSLKLIADSPLFAGIESGARVMRYHSLIADRNSLPSNLEVVAEVDGAPELVMALQEKSRKLFGLQFHPESVGTPLGQRIIENFIQLC